MAHSLIVRTVDVHQLASIVRNRIDNALVLDSRSFLEYNACHVVTAINVGCAKLMKRRLQQEKLSIEDFLAQNCHWDVDRSIDIIVYDQNTWDSKCLPPDSFMGVFLQKLLPVYNSVNLLKGGFLEFQATYPHLCEDERSKFAPLTSLSQPCLPITNHGPTRILPFLYLGSQNDALNQEALQHYNITYQLNVSTSCPKPDFIQEAHFMRIPVIDNYSEKLLPYFHKAFQFIDKVRESSGCVLIHCLAGISRSATVAIAYVMKSLRMTSDEAYRYVKAKRPTVSPNFNFLGQLLEFEKQLQQESILTLKSESSSTPMFNSSSLTYKQSYNKNYSCDFIENTALCSSQSQVSSSFCVKYADEAEVTPRSSDLQENFKSLKKSVNKNLGTCNHIPSKQSAATLNIKCLPVTSLKELNFMPCQTSNSIQSWKNSKNRTKDEGQIRNSATFPSVLLIPKKMENKRNSSFGELRFPDRLENLKGGTLVSPDLPTPNELQLFEFDSKSYNRSDSVSTSGLGSEGSDYADSWNDFTSSCERETDISMDDDYPSVPSDDGILQRNKLGSDRDGLEDSYGDSVSFYPKYEPYKACSTRHQLQKDYSQISSAGNAKIQSSKCEGTLQYADMGENAFHHIPDSSDYGKTQILYRAQSCPGMLSTEFSSLQSTNLDKTVSISSHVKLRKSKSKFSEDKCRNRYSCSSIDYAEYSLNASFSHDSCPDTLHLESGAKNPTISSSHCNYRHSMIQVS